MPTVVIERIHGLRGRMILKVFVYGPAAPLEEGTVLHAGERELIVTRSRKRDNERVTIDCEQVLTREQADEFRGTEVEVDESAVLRAGFPVPIYGFSSFTLKSGDAVYRVQSVEYNPVNPQLIVAGEDRSFPVPLNLALSGEVDAEERTITVQLPPGLEEL